MGTSLQVRMRLQTSRRSRSGRPGSSTMACGAWIAAWLSPSLPVSAIRTRWPKACSPTLQTLSRPGSSSMTRICGNLRLLGYGRRYRQREAEPRSALGSVLDPDALPVGRDEGLGDGQAEPGAGVAGAAGGQLQDLLAALSAGARTAGGGGHPHGLPGGGWGADPCHALLMALAARLLQPGG